MRTYVAVLAAAAITVSIAPAAYAAAPAEEPQPEVANAWSDEAPPPPSDRVIVRWAPGASRTDRAEARQDVQAQDFEKLGNKRFQVLSLADGQNPDQAVAELKNNPDVANASRDGYSALHATQPNDSLFDHLWGLDNRGLNVGGVGSSTPGDDISALDAWSKTVGDKP